MKENEDSRWRRKLEESFFPVALSDVYAGVPVRKSERFRAIMPTNDNYMGEPFSIVTKNYQLIKNRDAVDLGFAAAECIFGAKFSQDMTVFNVVMANSKGCFFADFTAKSTSINIPIPRAISENSSTVHSSNLHTYFLRVVNSYNKTMPIKLEIGVCRWMCRNGMIFGKQSIEFKDPHSKPLDKLVDQISGQAERINIQAISSQIAAAYQVKVSRSLDILAGVCQTLNLAIPQVNTSLRTSKLWKDRCASLIRFCHQYQDTSGLTLTSTVKSRK